MSANPPPIAHSERLLVVVGPSGAGKDSVLRAWRERLNTADVHFARRTITRAPDASEPHDSVSEGEFARLRAAGELATWWHAHGLLYGVRWRELRPLGEGAWVVLNGSRAHLATLRRQAPALQAVELSASPEVLAARLAQRGREDEAAITRRLAREVPSDSPGEVSLRLVNDGALAATVDTLHGWWCAQCAGPSPAQRPDGAPEQPLRGRPV